MSLVYLILGGNQGNRFEIISTAIDLVTSEIGPKMAVSSLYESESWGFKSEPFINQVIIVDTNLSPAEVLVRTQKIENQLGRKRSKEDYEARPIDIDLLYYDELILSDQALTLPHPRIAARRFVLVPLDELVPGKTDPITGKNIHEMLMACPDSSEVRLIS